MKRALYGLLWASLAANKGASHNVRWALLLIWPSVLLGALKNHSVRFIDDSRAPQAKSFFVDVGGHRIRIDRTGWYVDNAAGLRLTGATRTPRLIGVDPGPPTSYFTGRDPQAWIHGATTYTRLRETGAYPGIDLVYHESESGSIENDFLIAPRGEPRRIAFVWTGSGNPSINADGSLVLPAASGELKLAPPVAYQMFGERRTNVACRYTVRGNRVRFKLAAYDRARVLVIDPTLVFARVTGGLTSLVSDANGNWYTADFLPPTPGAYQPPLGIRGGVGITKRDPSGNELWTAYLNSIVSSNVSMAVDQAGNVYVAGAAGLNFPVTPGSFPQPPGFFAGGTNTPQTYGFICKLSADGSQLLYSTLLWTPMAGADGADQVTALAVTSDGQMTFAGTRFAFANYYYLGSLGGVLARLSGDGTSVLYSQPLNGTPAVVAVDPSGSAIVGGSSSQPDAAPVSLQPNLADATAYTSPDGGATVQPVIGAPVTTSIAIDPQNPFTVLRATTAGVFQSQDGGSTWNSIDALGAGYFSSVWIHPRRPQLWFASQVDANQPLLRSEDAGATWTSVQVPTSFAALFDDGPQILAYSKLDAAFSSQDAGKTWKELSVSFPGAAFSFPICCVVDPSDLQHFLVGSASRSGNSTGILETRDGGASFLKISFDTFLPLAFDPQVTNRVYGYNRFVRLARAISGYYVFDQIFRISDDGGKTWRLPNSGATIPTQQVAVDPSGSPRLYAFGPRGMYVSQDRGETWAQVNGMLSNAPLNGGTVSFGQIDRFYAIAQSQGDGFVTKVDPSGNLVFSTLIGGRSVDQVRSLLVLPSGDIAIGGATQSDDLLSSVGAPTRTSGGFEQGFLARLSADGTSLMSLRYVGGSSTDSVNSIALLSSGEIVIAGETASADQPDVTPDAIQSQFLGTFSGFLGVYSPDARAMRYFTLLGSVGGGFINAVASYGMRAAFRGLLVTPQLGAAALSCEDPSGLACTGLFGVMDLSQ